MIKKETASAISFALAEIERIQSILDNITIYSTDFHYNIGISDHDEIDESFPITKEDAVLLISSKIKPFELKLIELNQQAEIELSEKTDDLPF